MPIQVIDTRRLSPEENLWLRDLDNRLDAAETDRITAKIYKLEKAVQIGAYLDADVIEWLQSGGAGYQTRMNAILREAMLHSVS